MQLSFSFEISSVFSTRFCDSSNQFVLDQINMFHEPNQQHPWVIVTFSSEFSFEKVSMKSLERLADAFSFATFSFSLTEMMFLIAPAFFPKFSVSLVS